MNRRIGMMLAASMLTVSVLSLDAQAQSHASAKQIATLVSYQRAQDSIARKADASAGQKTCVNLNMSTLTTDPSDENGRRLDTIRKLIGDDCAARLARLKKSIPMFERLERKSLEQAYETRLSESQAQTLIDYYGSDEGARFLRFQASIAPFAAFGTIVHGGQRAPSGQVSRDTFQSRSRALRLSTGYAASVVDYEDAVREGRDTSGFGVLGIIISIAATDADATLDRIVSAYADDLPAFAAFESSEAEKQEQRAFMDAARRMLALQSAQIRTLDPNHNGNREHWQNVYDALPR